MLKITDKIENYKALQCINNKYIINWGLKNNNDFYGTWYYKIYNSRPSVITIKHDIEEFINANTKNKIINNFKWAGMNINLSSENQLNYKLLYDTTVLQNGKNLPEKVKFTIKDKDIYYSFETIDELKNFIIAMNNHIRLHLINGWEEKRSIDYSQFTL